MMNDDDDHIAESSRLLPINSSDSGKVTLTPKLPLTPIDNYLGKTRRKVRLKRRERNSRLSNGVSLPFSSANRVAASNSNSSFFNSCRHTSQVGRRQISSATTCSASFLLFVVLVVASMLSLSYYAVTLQGQISLLTVRLEAVIEDKQAYSDEHYQIKSNLESLYLNYTSLKENLTSYNEKFENLFFQINSLNSSLSSVMGSLKTSPPPQDLSYSVLKLETELADIGTKVTDLEGQFNGTKKEFLSSLNQITSKLDNLLRNHSNQTAEDDTNGRKFMMNRESERDLQYFLDKNLTSQLEANIQNLESNFSQFKNQVETIMKAQEDRTNRSWELLSQLEDNVQNVSAKANSCELICRETQETMNNKNILQTEEKRNDKIPVK